jgi:hypothetical protein
VVVAWKGPKCSLPTKSCLFLLTRPRIPLLSYEQGPFGGDPERHIEGVGKGDKKERELRME